MILPKIFAAHCFHKLSKVVKESTNSYCKTLFGRVQISPSPPDKSPDKSFLHKGLSGLCHSFLYCKNTTLSGINSHKSGQNRVIQNSPRALKKDGGRAFALTPHPFSLRAPGETLFSPAGESFLVAKRDSPRLVLWNPSEIKYGLLSPFRQDGCGRHRIGGLAVVFFSGRTPKKISTGKHPHLDLTTGSS